MCLSLYTCRLAIGESRAQGKKDGTAKETARLHTLLEALEFFPDHTYFLWHRTDKGGRQRLAPIVGPDYVRRRAGSPAHWPEFSLRRLHSAALPPPPAEEIP